MYVQLDVLNVVVVQPRWKYAHPIAGTNDLCPYTYITILTSSAMHWCTYPTVGKHMHIGTLLILEGAEHLPFGL